MKTPSLPQREQDKSHSTTYATLSDSKIIIAGKQTNVDELGIHSNSATANQQVNDLPDLAKLLEKQQIVQGATADIQSAVKNYAEQKRAEAEQARLNKDEARAKELERQVNLIELGTTLALLDIKNTDMRSMSNLALAGEALNFTSSAIQTIKNAKDRAEKDIINHHSMINISDFGGLAQYAESEASKGKYCLENPNTEFCVQRNTLPMNSIHDYYNDITIINVSSGITGITFVINNKNGKVFFSEHPDFSISPIPNLSDYLKKPSASVNFGSIKGGYKEADEIDTAIKGQSFGTQGCYGLCIGKSKAQNTKEKIGDTIYTYGIGTPQIGISGSTMFDTGIILTPSEIKNIINGTKNVK